MQINTLKAFVSEFEARYKKDFENSFEGKLARIKTRFTEPFLHSDEKALTKLDMILSSTQKPINIGIIGQFSSGKSSLLNLILQKDILPTGAVPVTSKPTFLKYGLAYALKVEFENGFEKLCDVSEIALYTDQRKELREVKSLTLFAPIELLKKLTLVDMPGLNANAKDEKSSLTEFELLHSIIWLSLIDNAGKKSEEEAIIAHLELIKDNQSLCILNQKDKLNELELSRVMAYANEVFGKYFDKIIAISCKEAKTDYELSNFSLLLEHLQSIDTRALQVKFVRSRLLTLCELYEKQYDDFESNLNKLETIFTHFQALLNEKEANLKQEITLLSNEILHELKAMSEKIAKEIATLITEKEAEFFVPHKGLLHKGFFEKKSYKYAFLSSDDVFLALFYHNEAMNKEFKKMKREIFEHYNALKADLTGLFEYLEEKISLFKAEFLNFNKDEALQSEFEFSRFRAFVGMSDELFLKDFKHFLFEELLKLDLFFEKLDIKSLTNYKSASKLSLSFFAKKINESRKLFELDSTQFSLYSPSLNEIYERLLTELEVYEFEVLLVQKPFILKQFQNLKLGFESLILQKKSIIQEYKEQLNKQRQWILDTKAMIENLSED